MAPTTASWMLSTESATFVSASPKAPDAAETPSIALVTTAWRSRYARTASPCMPDIAACAVDCSSSATEARELEMESQLELMPYT